MKKMENEIQVMIDEQTIRRHGALYVDGDYAIIAALVSSTKGKVGKCLKKTKIASFSVARAMKKYYLEKEKLVAELNS